MSRSKRRRGLQRGRQNEKHRNLGPVERQGFLFAGDIKAAAREPRVSARMTNRDRMEIQIFQASVHVLIGWFVHCIPVPRAHVRVSHRDLVQILQKLENLTVNKVLDRQRHLTPKHSLHGNKSF